MAPREIKNLSLPERLRIEIEKVAKAQDRSVNDVLAEAAAHYIERYVKDQQWASLKHYGRDKAKEQGIGEADVDRLMVGRPSLSIIARKLQKESAARGMTDGEHDALMASLKND